MDTPRRPAQRASKWFLLAPALLASSPVYAQCTCLARFAPQASGCFEASPADPRRVVLTETAERACLGFSVTRLEGRGGNDYIEGAAVAETIHGGEGDDTIWGRDGDDTIYGQGGMDVIRGNDGDDVIRGGQGDDQLWGGPGDDTVYGGGGNDRYFYRPGDGNDVLDDRQGHEVLVFRGIVAGSVTKSTEGDGTLVLNISQAGTSGQVRIVKFDRRPGWSIVYEDQP